MTPNIPVALRDANDALELAELGLAHILDDIDVRTGRGDARLIVAAEAIAIARSHIGARTLAWERLERENGERSQENAPVEKSITFEPAPFPQAALDAVDREIEAFKKGKAPERATPGARPDAPRLDVGELDQNTRDEFRERAVGDPDERVTVRDLTRELDVSESQFYRWIHSGRIKTYKLPGNRRTYIRSDDVHMLRAIAATIPPNRTSMAAWISKSLQRAGR